MKKIKSLMSLMLVMIFMLSLAGPMAFAAEPTGTQADPFVVKIKANTPYFSGSAYVTNGVITEPATGLPLYEGTHFTVNITDNGASVTVTPSALNAVNGVVYSQDVDKYYKPTFESYTLNKPEITVAATAPVVDLATGEITSAYQHTGGTLESGERLSFAKAPVVTYNESTGIATATVSKDDISVISNDGTDITKKYNIVVSGNESELATSNKTTVKVEPKAPVYTDLQFKSNGLKQASFVISVGNTTPSVRVSCDLDVVDNGATVTVTPKNVVVHTDDLAQTDLTEYVNLEIVPTVFTKPVVDVYARTPILNSTGTAYVEDGARVVFESDDLHSTYITNTIVTVNVSGKTATVADVVILDGAGANVTNYFNVITHGAAVDGGTAPGGNNSTTPDTTPDTPTTTKTKLVIQAVDAEKAYNGYSFSSSQARGVKYANNTSLLSGHSLNASVLKIQYTRRSDGVMFNDYTDVYKVGTYDKKLIVPATNVVLDAAGNDVTSQYDISTIDGILTIYNSGWVSPDTGDHSNMVLWIVLLAASAVAVAAVVFVVLKKGKKA